jgi:hypothetical protein
MAQRIPLTDAQAQFLRSLKAEAERAQHNLALALNVLGLAVDDNGDLTYDLGPEPWIEVAPKPKA